MTTSRERFLDTLEFKNVNPRWLRTSCAWQETLDVWRTQGYQGQPLDKYFGVDRIMRVDPYYGPVPEFEHTVVEEDDRTITYINHEGILMREFKQHRDTSMPQFIKFPVENEGDFEKLRAERLALNPEQRLSPQWRTRVASGGVAGRVNEDLLRAESLYKGSAVQDDPPRQCWADRWGGYFGSIRNMMGVENL